jgi:phosphoribosylaminoimidazolecarboxamide formyltransferase/IMP cyclohydrolase
MDRKPLALLSVFDKQGIVEFAQELVALGFDLLSSGGTAKVLREAGLTVTDVAELSGLSAILDHRVVTLVPQVHGGLLALDKPEHHADLAKIGAKWIDLCCVDLYPLQAEIAKPEHTRESVIEKTDIGGPTMLRAAAKGRRITICDPADRMKVIGWLKEGKPDADNFINSLCAKVEGVIADYCLAAAREHSGGDIDGMVGTKTLTPKYGENAYQTPAGLYKVHDDDPLALHRFQVVAGQPPSYNNLCDLDRLLQTATHIASVFNTHGDLAIAVKHGNPCGAACHYDSWEGAERSHHIDILKKMIDGDKRAIFGGLVMTTFELDEELAEILLTHGMENGRRLLDGIIAPGFTSGAIEYLKRKKDDKCRFIVNSALKNLSRDSLDRRDRMRYVRGGFLMQPNYTFVPNKHLFNLVDPERGEMTVIDSVGADCMLAWAIGSTSNSNTITLVKKGMLIGNAVGQQDRVGCCELALKRARDAGHDPKGAVAYSDSFFPFEDGPQVLADAGIRAIFATSGSLRDGVVKLALDKAGVRFYTLPDAEARGFFGH